MLVPFPVTSQPHDGIFKAAFEHCEHAGAVVRRLFPALETIAWETMESETASFIDEELAKHHTDLLFSVRIANAPAYIYFLLEHQSTNEEDMPFRGLVYLVRIWKRHRKRERKHSRKRPRGPLPVILTIVISNAEGGWKGPLSFHDLCEPHPASIPGIADLVPQFTLALVDLSRVSNEELVAWALDAFPKAVLFALRDVRDPEKLLRGLEHWGALVAEASRAPSGMDALRQLMRYIALASPRLNIQDFRDKIREYLPTAETELMTIYEQALQEGREQGRAQGREQGREQGRHETQVSILTKQLTLKFGELSTEYEARLQAASAEDLEVYVERILIADTLAAVFGEPG
jgi:predicted transposase YdaD